MSQHVNEPIPQFIQPQRPVPKIRPKKIGEGSYGCVYRPSIPCLDKEPIRDTISKVITYSNAMVEVQNTNMVTRIDRKQVFHYAGYGGCKLNYYPDDCHIQSEYQVVQKDGGYSLKTYIDRNRRHAGWYPNIPGFITGWWRLFVGLYVLHNNDMYHMDIKPDNIIVKSDRERYKMKYIDFGLLRKGGDFEKWDCKHNYPWYPIETILLNPKMITHMLDLIGKNKSVDEFIDSVNRIFNMDIISDRSLIRTRYTFEDPIQLGIDMRNNLGYIMKKFEQRLLSNPETSVQDLMRLIYTRVDVYSLGVTLRQLRPIYSKDNQNVDDIDMLVKNMSEVNIDSRCGPHVALCSFNQILKRLNVMDMTTTNPIELADLMIPLERVSAIQEQRRNIRC